MTIPTPAPRDGDPFDPTGIWSDLVASLSKRHDLKEMLYDVATLAVRSVPAAEDCSITLVSGTSAFSPAHVGDLARKLDENQFRLGNGPCLDAGVSGEPLLIEDVDEDDRWPAYLSIATVIGLGSSLSVPLPLQQEVLGAINFYSRTPRAFDAESIALAQRLSGHVAAVVSQAPAVEDAQGTATGLRESMRDRAVIEQAKGILMAVRRCSSAAAFEVLRSMAQEQQRTLRAVAVSLVSEASGQDPADVAGR